MDIAGVIRRALAAKGWSSVQLAKEVGVSRQTVAAWLQGKAAPNRKRAPAVAIALDLPLGVISGDPGLINVDQLGPDTENGDIPLLEWDQAWVGRKLVTSKSAKNGRTERIKPAFEVSDAAFGLRIKGDAMEPAFSEGEIIIVDPKLTPTDGCYVIAGIGKNSTGEVTFKQYRPRGQAEGFNVFDLVPLNPSHETITINKPEAGRVIGVVTEHRRLLIKAATIISSLLAVVICEQIETALHLIHHFC